MNKATTNANITNNTNSDTRSWAHSHSPAVNGGGEGAGERKDERAVLGAMATKISIREGICSAVTAGWIS